ncbi:MAG: hypothetical protein WDM80_09110 [Limisphaerales bacterium]
MKMLLCATASESNTNREGLANNPTLQRAANGTNGFPASKDQYEGYGMINPDAAVEAVSQALVMGDTNSFTLGPTATDPRAWARKVNLPANANFAVSLTVPGTGDYDLYLYSATPGLLWQAGDPRLQHDARANGQNESLAWQSSTNTTAYLVVKRHQRFGQFQSGRQPARHNSSSCRAGVDFWIARQAGVSAQEILVVSNAGPGILNGLAALLNADEFSILSGTPFTIAAQDSTNLLVQFAPLTPGGFTNNLAFMSNGGSSTNQVTGRAHRAAVAAVTGGGSHQLSFLIQYRHRLHLFDSIQERPH